jgi:hypothetical protein
MKELQLRNRSKEAAVLSGIHSGTSSASGSSLEDWLAETINTPNTNAYDKIIDSVYLSEGTGGSRLHHLVDGQHDLLGAFQAARSAYPDDSFAVELLGTAQHLAKDLFSKMGLPVFSLDPQSYANSSEWISDKLGISRTWQADFLQINGLELFGGCLAAVGVVLGIRSADLKVLAEIAGGCGLAAVLAANPISMIAACVAMGYAILQCRSKGDARNLAEHGAVGLASASTVSITGSALSGLAAAGALPAIGSICLSIVAGMVVRQWLRKTLVSPEPTIVHKPRPVLRSVIVDQPDTERRWKLHLQDFQAGISERYSPETLAIFRMAFA